MQITTARTGSGVQSQYRSKRIFYHSTLDGDVQGWCFAVRGGLVYGPFISREMAEDMLEGLKTLYRLSGNNGGRATRQGTVN